MKLTKIKTKADGTDDVKVLVIYTGGTLGMVYEAKTEISVLTFDNLLDSSNMNPSIWMLLAKIIGENYARYDSFVILHGTDTMAYTASALSYLLENLNKPVILTGAQLPIGVARTDAKENFITALEIAADRNSHKHPYISEVCIYFNSLLLRGNRARKHESVQFNAFESENYPVLAEAGVKIEYNKPYLRHLQLDSNLKVHQQLDENVVIMKLFPGISANVIRNILEIKGLRGVVLETFGSGNAPTEQWFLSLMKEFVEKGIIIFNVSQCNGGRVMQGRYQTSHSLQEMGVVSGADLTTEAAITKLMFALGQSADIQEVKKILRHSFAGEMS
jgi:L-asparaginase